MEAYVTLEIGAELEGMKYDAFQKSVARKRDKYLVRTVVPENGGREVVMVAVSSLSKSGSSFFVSFVIIPDDPPAFL